MASLSPQQHRSRFGDTTLTKVFVGGLAWETPTEVFREYFEQFGEILEAVIITDKNTGRSKGYGFVTYRDPESARRSVANPNPEIDGRRANCNIASQGRPRLDPPRVRNQTGGTEQGPLPHAAGPSYRLRAQMPPPQFYYSTQYGYMPYPSGYGYQQGMYNPQIASQYYQQYYAQSSTPNGGTQPYPYPYVGYAMQSPRPGFPSPFHPQRQSYIQYNNPMIHSNEAAFAPSLPQNFQLQAPPNSRQTPNTADSQTDQQSSGGANSESLDE